MQTDEEWLSRPGIVVDSRHRAVGEQIGQISSLLNFCVTVPQVISVCIRRRRLVRKVVQAAAAKSPEMIVAALERTVIRQITQMPFPDERGGVTCFLQ